MKDSKKSLVSRLPVKVQMLLGVLKNALKGRKMLQFNLFVGGYLFIYGLVANVYKLIQFLISLCS